MQDDGGDCYELSLVGYKCIGAYARNKKNQNQVPNHLYSVSSFSNSQALNQNNQICLWVFQICWIWQKQKSSNDDRGFQRFLDTVQYKCSGILRYERVFGPGFVSTGGIGKS